MRFITHTIKSLFNVQPQDCIDENTEVFIHVGSYKTATSYTQNLFFSNKKRLSSHYGVLYPKSGLTRKNMTGKRHYLLAQAVKNSDPTLFMKLEKELKNTQCQKVFISSEYLSRFTLEDIKRFKSYLPKTTKPIKILLTVRRQDQYIESLYAQFTQCSQNTLDFESFIKEHYFLLDYYNIASKWSCVFGQENIIISGFKSNIKKGLLKAIFTPILESFDSLIKLKEPSKRNNSIGEKNCQLMFNLNHIFQRSKGFRGIGHFINVRKIKDRPVSLFTVDERMRFLDNFNKSNNALFNDFGNDTKDELTVRSDFLPYKSNIYRDYSTYKEPLEHFVNRILIVLFLKKNIHRYFPILTDILKNRIFSGN